MKYLFVLLIFLVGIILNAQETVSVTSRELGNGIQFSRFDECFVLTPDHVVHDFSGAISIRDDRNLQATARLFESYPNDLAILRFETTNTTRCESLIVEEGFDALVRQASSGTVEYLDSLGVLQLIHVNITSKTSGDLTISPMYPKDVFRPGMSGSSFYLNNTEGKVLVGMVMSIEENGVDAYVYKLDAMITLLSPFLKDSRNGPLRLGVLLLNFDNSKYAELTNKVVTALNTENFTTVGNFDGQNTFIKSYQKLLDGDHDLRPNARLTSTLDQLFMGKLDFQTTPNEKKMYIVEANLEAALFSTKDLSILKTVSVIGKGLGFSEHAAKKQAIKNLITNILNQFK